MTVTIGGDANKGNNSTLEVKDVSLQNSAVYFCAASLHSDTYYCASVQKPSHRLLLNLTPGINHFNQRCHFILLGSETVGGA